VWICLAGFGVDAAVVCDDTADVIKGLLLDFYGTVVEEDDEVVASICARAAATAPGMVTPQQVGGAWWQAFQAEMAASVFRPK